MFTTESDFETETEGIRSRSESSVRIKNTRIDKQDLECTSEQLKYMCKVLELVTDNKFKDRYVTYKGFPECRIFPHITDLKICLEVLARFPLSQEEAFRAHKICSHEEFEKRIETYTKTKVKPNEILFANRNWDVAINMFMKVEFFDHKKRIRPQMITLKKETKIYEFMWEKFVAEGGDLGEMTGIPMLFDYRFIANKHCLFSPLPKHKEIDTFGSVTLMEPDQNQLCSSLRYLTTERLGPHVSYLLEICGSQPNSQPVFTFATAFKVFDQLVCRLLQLHRLGITHNNVEPKHIHFGRHTCSDIVYLNSYKAATILQTDSSSRLRLFLGSYRFGSLEVMKGYARHPVHDIESAFYTLLAMLVPVLPWDESVSMYENQSSSKRFEEEFDLQRTEDEETLSERAEEKRRSILVKSELWGEDENLFKQVLSSIRETRRSVEEDKAAARVDLGLKILESLFQHIKATQKEYRQKPQEETLAFCKNLRVATSKEYQIYIELRRWALMFFNFGQLENFMDDPTYKKQLEARESNAAIGWDLSNWCFSHIVFKASEN